MSAQVEEFGKILVKLVRDRTIQNCDHRLTANAGGPIAKRWRQDLHEATKEELAMSLIPDVVDDTIFHLLDAIDQGLLKMSMSSNGKTVDLAAEGLGELAGWYMGNGWRNEYSEERFTNICSDV